MAIADAVPTIVAARMIRYLRGRYVYAARTNRTWQPDAAYGDEVDVVPIDDTTVSVSDWTKNGTIAYNTVAPGTHKSIQLNTRKYWAIKIDDVDRVQARPNILEAGVQVAADKLAKEIDDDIRGEMTPGTANVTIPSSGSIAVNAAISDANALAVMGAFVAAKRHLAIDKVPEGERVWAIVSPWTLELLTLILGTTQDTGRDTPDVIQADTMRNGFSGRFYGVDVYVNSGQSASVASNVYTDQVVFGTDYSLAFIEQIRKVERLRLQTTFADAVRGLYVYGYEDLASPGFLRADIKTGSHVIT